MTRAEAHRKVRRKLGRCARAVGVLRAWDGLAEEGLMGPMAGKELILEVRMTNK